MFMFYSPEPCFEESLPSDLNLKRRVSSPTHRPSSTFRRSSDEVNRDSVNRIPEALKQMLIDLEDPFAAPSPVIRAPTSAPTSRRSSARRKHSDLPPIKPPPSGPIPRLPRPPPSEEVKRILAQPTLLSRPTHPRSRSNPDAVPTPVSATSSSITLVEGPLSKSQSSSPASSIKTRPNRPRSRSNASDTLPQTHERKPREVSLPNTLPPIPPLRLDTRLRSVPSQMAEVRRKSAATATAPRPLGAAIDDAWLIAQARNLQEGWGEDLKHGETQSQSSHYTRSSSSIRRSVSSTSSSNPPSISSACAYPISSSVASQSRTSLQNSPVAPVTSPITPITPTSPNVSKVVGHQTEMQRILAQPTLLNRKPTPRHAGRQRSSSDAEPPVSPTLSLSSEGPPSSFRSPAIRSPTELETTSRARSKSRDSKATTASHDGETPRRFHRASAEPVSPEKRGRLWKAVSLGLVR